MSTEAKKATAGVRLRVPQRDQVIWEAQCLEKSLAAAHPARTVWKVVGALDLSGFYGPIKARAGVCGRDATDPRLLVGLWLYATIRGVGSARELARLCGAEQGSKPYIWLCGGVSVNHHTLSDFRVEYGQALDELLTRVIASLVRQNLVKVYRISQDGMRVRACAGASSFRRKERLGKLLEEARAHVAQMKALLEDPEKSAGLSAKKKAARQRAARERQERIEQALAQLPGLEEKQKKLGRKRSAQDKARGKLKEPRASSTDAEARVMKMSNGGFNAAMNIQFATDTHSRAIVGVEVVGEGTDSGQGEPMRQQVEQRSGAKVQEHLMDGGYLSHDQIEAAEEQGVKLFVPPKPPRNKDKRGSEYEPRPGDSEAIRAWRQRMGSAEGQEVYKLRASTSETVNADARTHRGLSRLLVRGVAKARCVALWFALAYNVMHFAAALMG